MTKQTMFKITVKGELDLKPRFVAVTKAVETKGVSGIYSEIENLILSPDYDAITEGLPHYWREAWKRANMWFNRDAKLCENGLVYPPNSQSGMAFLYSKSKGRKRLAIITAEAYVLTV